MYRKVSLSSFHNGKVEYCAIFGSGDIEENASVIFFYSDFRCNLSITCDSIYTDLFYMLDVVDL